MATKIMSEEIRNRVSSKRNILQQIEEWKLKLFGHICITEDNRLVKGVVTRVVREDGRGIKKGRQRKGWLDIKEWCNDTCRKDRVNMGKIVKHAFDTNV